MTPVVLSIHVLLLLSIEEVVGCCPRCRKILQQHRLLSVVLKGLWPPVVVAAVRGAETRQSHSWHLQLLQLPGFVLGVLTTECLWEMSMK